MFIFQTQIDLRCLISLLAPVTRVLYQQLAAPRSSPCSDELWVGIFRHLKLELLELRTQFPASNDEKFKILSISAFCSSFEAGIANAISSFKWRKIFPYARERGIFQIKLLDELRIYHKLF